MGAIAIAYVVLCEFLFGVIFGFYSVTALLGKQGPNEWRAAVICGLISASLFVIGIGLIRRSPRAYWASWIVGACVITLGSYFMWDSARIKAHYTGEEGFGFGVGLILTLPALIGFVLLAIPAARNFISKPRFKAAPSTAA